jgi:hypothetical protein
MQSLWESEVLVEQFYQGTDAESLQAFEPAAVPEGTKFVETEQREPESAPPAEVLALSVDDFSALEERVLRTVSLVKQERAARTEAEHRAAHAEARLLEQEPLADRLQSEVQSLRVERDHVRQRVERLLSQLDSLEL